MRRPDARLSLEDLEESIASALRGEVSTCVWAGVDPVAELLDELAANPTAANAERVRAIGAATIAEWNAARP